MSVCKGCGTELPPKTKPGRRQEWCSDKCRRDTTYARNCVDCNASLSTSDGNGPNAPVRCLPCAGALRKVWTPETIVAAIRRWAIEHEGVPPVAADWNTALGLHRGRGPRGEGYPPVSTVQRVFGKWGAAIEAAGFTPFAPGHYNHSGQRLASEVLVETAALYRQGLTLAQVGERLGLSEAGVWHRLRAADEPRRPPGGSRPRQVAA